jgi:aerobic carbon-monoxide dehydrogenase medium subunit
VIRFEYLEPSTLDEAVALLGRHGEAAHVLAGGTDLLVEIREHLRRPRYVMNIKRIPGMSGLSYDPQAGLRVGALVTARELELMPDVQRHYPGLAQALRELGSIQVRNRATLAGNICRASPSADTLPPLIADGARVRLHGGAGARELPLEEFFTGPGRTQLRPDELLTEIVVPPPPARCGKAYIKHGRRKAMELATVGVAVNVRLENGRFGEVRICLGAVAPTAIRAARAEALLAGQAPDAARIAEAAQAAREESRPISNVRGSAEYRREMVAVLTRRALEQAVRAAS